MRFSCIEQLCDYHRVINYMDQSWMNASRMSPTYEEDVEYFSEFTFERSWLDEDGKCYINCLNGRWQVFGDIREHLLCDGIKKNYTTWIWHGELTDMQRGSQSESVDVEMRECNDPPHCYNITTLKCVNFNF